MPERAINTKSATGCLLILLPAALTMSALFVAWPVILGVTLLIAGGNLWQSTEWSKTARSIDPVFQQLIIKNRGEITPLDLSLDAKIPGSVSNRYLAAKAMEFGTGSRQHPERGQIYYFVSVSTLGSIFDDSELAPASLMPATTPVVAAEPMARQAQAIPEVISQAESTPPVATPMAASMPITSEPISEPATPAVTSELSNLRQLFDDRSESSTTPVSEDVAQLPVVAEAPTGDVAIPTPTAPPADVAPATEAPAAPPASPPSVTILQSELAKRLDVHSSTIYKRRSEPNFTGWTRNRDPDGLGWGYLEDKKEYYRVDT